MENKSLRTEVGSVIPARLETPYADFAYQVALEWAQNNPSIDAEVNKAWFGATLGSGDFTTIRQTQYTDEDVDWYLKKINLPNRQAIAELIDRNLTLLPTAKVAFPHMAYFFQSLENEQRMKKDVYAVQACIQIAVHNSAITLPIEVVEYVLYGCPQYGAWLEQHIDEFYRVLRRA